MALTQAVPSICTAAPVPGRFDRVVADICQVAYPLWAVITLFRETPLAIVVTSLFRHKAAPREVATMGSTGTLAGCALAAGEAVMMAALFARSAWRCAENRAEIARHRHACAVLGTWIENTRRQGGGGMPDGAASAAAMSDPAEFHATAPLLGGAAAAAHDLPALVQGYRAHRAASAARPGHVESLWGATLACVRDTVMQGGMVACNLVQQWHVLDLGRWLSLASAPVSIPLTLTVGGVFCIATNALQIVAGGVLWHRARQMVARAKHAGKTLQTCAQSLKTRVDEAGAHARQQCETALPVCTALLNHADRSQAEAIDAARKQIASSKRRIAFGAVATVIASVSLVLLLVLGTVGTGGMLIGMTGLAAGFIWLLEAGRKSRENAVSLASAAIGVAAPAHPMTLDQAVAAAVDLLDPRDGAGRDAPVARKLVKRTLRDLGMPAEDFHPVKWIPDGTDPAVRRELKAELGATIRRFVAGDAMRQASAQGVKPSRTE